MRGEIRVLAAALFVLGACGRRFPDVDLPPRTTTAPALPAGAPAITLTLTADGRILARGNALSLDGLGTLLRSESALRETLPDTSFQAARLVARLRIDRAVPWQHVQWALTILAEQKVWRTRFVYADPVLGDADLEWNLPYDHP